MSVSSSIYKPLKGIMFIIVIALFEKNLLFSETFYSPTWGFKISPPAGYTYSGGDGKYRFSFNFENRAPAYLDLRIYEDNHYTSIETLGKEIQKRIASTGEISGFTYQERQALLMELHFSLNGKQMHGWGLCVELEDRGSSQRPILAALAYGDATIKELDNFNLSALDSIVPTKGDELAPGPVSVYAFPGQESVATQLAGLSASAMIDPEAAQACKATVDREFSILSAYGKDSLWKEAWIRFYQIIYRDSYSRLSDIAFAVERDISKSLDAETRTTSQRDRLFAERTLAWVQQFTYERDLLGSDFVDLVSAATEGRGDCDSRAMLWAIILRHNNIPSAIMVSRDYSHAMGLAQLEGPGARFSTGSGDSEQTWIVAETTAQVPLGLIGKSVADPLKWIPVLFE
ncbi:hypothetical protein [Gracilinema caldarium]|uniref:Transglutaminase domain-containing protein n=1 Tax=Gracilinema caldarium (strain ATCC 51460 / DSM 7334 / H1) TaxID=744872 RepID=F8EXG9_GRAC1|nr:hypothetical protein [Gracilinema caldarium]AEJ19196.1 transglutaminase domain-containing protein [Gracilinema caldarium DSM 7334]